MIINIGCPSSIDKNLNNFLVLTWHERISYDIILTYLCGKMEKNIEKLNYIWYNFIRVYVTFESVIYLRGNGYGNKVRKEKIQTT